MPYLRHERRAEIASALADDELLDAMREWVGACMSPEEVFPVRKLESWAESHGYTKNEESD